MGFNIKLGDLFLQKRKGLTGVFLDEDTISISVLAKGIGLKFRSFSVENFSVSGEKRESELGKYLRQFTGRHSEIFLNLDLKEPLLNFRRITIPSMSSSEIEGALRWSLKDKIMLNISQAIISFEIIREVIGKDKSKKLDVMAVVVKKDEIQKYIDLFGRFKLALAGITATPLSIKNIIKVNKDLSKKDIVVVCNIGSRKTDVCIYGSAKLEFVRNIPLGMEDIIKSLVGFVVTDKGRMELTRAEAKEIIETSGIPGMTIDVLGGRVKSSQLIPMVRPTLERLVGDINRSLAYYSSEFGKKGIEEVYLSGRGAEIKGIKEFLSRQLSLDVKILSYPQDLSFEEGTLKKDQIDLRFPAYCLSLGAALGSGERINLLPPEVLKQRKSVFQQMALRLLIYVVVLVLTLLIMIVRFQMKGFNRQIEYAKSQRAILEQVKTFKSEVSQGEGILNKTLASEVPAEWILKELSSSIPRSVQLKRLILDQQDKRLTLFGWIYATAEAADTQLANFMLRLQNSSLFKDVHLVSRKKDRTEGAYTFEMSCDLKTISK